VQETATRTDDPVFFPLGHAIAAAFQVLPVSTSANPSLVDPEGEKLERLSPVATQLVWRRRNVGESAAMAPWGAGARIVVMALPFTDASSGPTANGAGEEQAAATSSWPIRTTARRTRPPPCWRGRRPDANRHFVPFQVSTTIRGLLADVVADPISTQLVAVTQDTSPRLASRAPAGQWGGAAAGSATCRSINVRSG